MNIFSFRHAEITPEKSDFRVYAGLVRISHERHKLYGMENPELKQLAADLKIELPEDKP